ncbi:uncharacterized protein LOC133028863 [Limanda limanda]|uniref:uncharacterized protein LOC133028863 n=1 Tax=Limanda limanda TaxID=27771 RepID=UPI0029C8BAEE|nr:uncharacterized protein LOC133028863 [Limanda limanda]
MTKTGKPDSYWEAIMYQYAQGKFRFSTGKKPGGKKWKAVMQLIKSCPLIPIFNLPIREIDIFGGQIACKCGYHKWFERVHANEILGHLDEMKGVITSIYGRILKLNSTKKITKKLAGDIVDSATWMTNVTNECGQVLNCVLTTGEGAGLDELCQGIVKRVKDAGEPEPEVIYVDRDCCSGTGLRLINPESLLEWNSTPKSALGHKRETRSWMS